MHPSTLSGAGADGLGSKVAQYGEVLAEAILNIAIRIVTPISSGANVASYSEGGSGVGRRYIWVLCVSEALRTNSRLWAVLSNVELGDATTREAIRFPSVDSTSGLYKEFRQLKSYPINSRTHHYIDAPGSAIYLATPFAKRW